MKRPKIITTTPPIILITSRYSNKNLPITDDEIPSVIKMKEKPAIKASEFVTVRYLILFLSEVTVRSLKESPVIKETYDGTKGRTHGDRNDSTPAIKASV